jgi:hypothetical protein
MADHILPQHPDRIVRLAWLEGKGPGLRQRTTLIRGQQNYCWRSPNYPAILTLMRFFVLDLASPARQRIDAMSVSGAISHTSKRRVLSRVKLRTLAGCPREIRGGIARSGFLRKTNVEYDGHGTT